MSINEKAPDRSAPVLQIKTPSGEPSVAVYRLPNASPGRVAHSLYVVQEGDRYEALASRLFQDATLWWVIAEINPEHFYAESIPPGTVIRLPVV